MWIALELKYGPDNNENVTPKDIEEHIERLKRKDDNIIFDTISILRGIQAQMKNGRIAYSRKGLGHMLREEG